MLLWKDKNPTSSHMETQRENISVRMYFETISSRNKPAQTTSTSSARLNEPQNTKARLCQTLWENCHLCSPAVCALILLSASTSAVQKHTLAWNCYKASCSLSVWDFVLTMLCALVCVWLKFVWKSGTEWGKMCVSSTKKGTSSMCTGTQVMSSCRRCIFSRFYALSQRW